MKKGMVAQWYSVGMCVNLRALGIAPGQESHETTHALRVLDEGYFLNK